MSPLGALRRCNPGAPLRRVLWWRFCQTLVWLAVVLLYRHRAYRTRNIPREGPTLLVCNHQSFLDLIVLGCNIQHRHFHSMARQTLFDRKPVAWLIRSLNGFPVDQTRGDTRAIRAAIDRIKAGHLVLVFPEGSRTPDGRPRPFAKGVMTLIRRTKPTVVPMAVEGVHDVWPMGRPLPRLTGRTAAIYGEPIDGQQLAAADPDEAVQLLEQRVDALRMNLRSTLRHQTEGRYPPPGPGDHPLHD